MSITVPAHYTEVDVAADVQFDVIIGHLRDLGHDPKMSVEEFEIALGDLVDWKQKHFDPLRQGEAK